MSKNKATDVVAEVIAEQEAAQTIDARNLVGIKEAAQILDLSTQVTRKAFASGQIAGAAKPEGRWRAPRRAVEFYRDNRPARGVATREVPEGMMTVLQVAEATGYHPQYVRKLMHKGRWDAAKINGQWLASDAAVEADSGRSSDRSLPEGIVGVEEMASRLGYSVHYVRKQCRDGKLGASKMSGQWTISEDDLDVQVEARDAAEAQKAQDAADKAQAKVDAAAAKVAKAQEKAETQRRHAEAAEAALAIE